MIIDLIDELYESGELRPLMRCGIISPQILSYRKIYHAYQERIDSGRKKMEANDDVCFVFNVSQRQVYRVLEIMRQEC